MGCIALHLAGPTQAFAFLKRRGRVASVFQRRLTQQGVRVSVRPFGRLFVRVRQPEVVKHVAAAAGGDLLVAWARPNLRRAGRCRRRILILILAAHATEGGAVSDVVHDLHCLGVPVAPRRKQTAQILERPRPTADLAGPRAGGLGSPGGVHDTAVGLTQVRLDPVVEREQPPPFPAPERPQAGRRRAASPWRRRETAPRVEASPNRTLP